MNVSQLTDAIARASGRQFAEVNLYARRLREAGMIERGSGRISAEATPGNAALILLAMMTAPSARQAKFCEQWWRLLRADALAGIAGPGKPGTLTSASDFGTAFSNILESPAIASEVEVRVVRERPAGLIVESVAPFREEWFGDVTGARFGQWTEAVTSAVTLGHISHALKNGSLPFGDRVFPDLNQR